MHTRVNVFGKAATDGVFYNLPLAGSGGAVQITGSLTTSEAIPSSYEFGQISAVGGTVTTLAISMTATRIITFQAHLNNSQTVYIGGAASTITGLQLAPGDSITLDFDDSTTSFSAFCSATSLINYAAFK